MKHSYASIPSILMYATLSLPVVQAEGFRLQDGGVISIKCGGNTEGPRLLRGEIRTGSVWLATGRENQTGTRWKVHERASGVFAFRCLSQSDQPRWLSANAATGKAGLQTVGGRSGEPKWRVVEGGDGFFRLQFLGRPPRYRWLDGNTTNGSVRLARETRGNSGTRWSFADAESVETEKKAQAPSDPTVGLQKMREWKSKGGKSVVGSLMRIEPGRIHLRLQDGQSGTVRLTDLSGEDLDFIRETYLVHATRVKDINNALSMHDILWFSTIIDRGFAFHKKLLGISTEGIRFPIRLFNSEKEYRSYQKKTSDSRSGSGYYSGSRRELVVYKTESYFGTVVHEAQHYVLRSKFRGYIPSWISEGLSEYYENASIESGIVIVKENPRKRERLQRWLQEGELPPMSAFLVMSNKEWKEQDRPPDHRNYAISWGLVYFLMSTQEGRDALSGTIQSLRGSNKHAALTLHRLYEGGVNSLDKDLRAFLGRVPAEQAAQIADENSAKSESVD